MRRRGLVLGAAMIGAILGASISTLLDEGDAASRGADLVRIVDSRFGRIVAATKPGASCQALVGLPTGANRPHKVGEVVVAGADGVVRWTYVASAPGTSGIVSHTVTCNYAGATATVRSEFELDREKD